MKRGSLITFAKYTAVRLVATLRAWKNASASPNSSSRAVRVAGAGHGSRRHHCGDAAHRSRPGRSRRRHRRQHRYLFRGELYVDDLRDTRGGRSGTPPGGRSRRSGGRVRPQNVTARHLDPVRPRARRPHPRALRRGNRCRQPEEAGGPKTGRPPRRPRLTLNPVTPMGNWTGTVRPEPPDLTARHCPA